MTHASIIESSKRKVQTGTETLRHILVVDDDPMACMAMEVYLQRNNFRVTIAEGGEAGLRALGSKQFDLMIYPTQRHGLSNPAQVKHWYTMMTDYVLKNL